MKKPYSHYDSLNYCEKCGSKLQEKLLTGAANRTNSRYNTQTGEYYQAMIKYCPNKKLFELGIRDHTEAINAHDWVYE